MNIKKGIPQFQGGYCRFPLSIMKAAMRDFIANNHLGYERRPIEKTDINEGNPYHGNILMKDGLSKQTRTIIQVALASLAGLVIRR